MRLNYKQKSWIVLGYKADMKIAMESTQTAKKALHHLSDTARSRN